MTNGSVAVDAGQMKAKWPGQKPGIESALVALWPN